MSEKELIGATNSEIKERLKQLAQKNYDKGFNDAIDKVLYYLEEEIKMHETAAFNSRYENKGWVGARGSLVIFKNLLIELFKTVAVES